MNELLIFFVLVFVHENNTDGHKCEHKRGHKRGQKFKNSKIPKLFQNYSKSPRLTSLARCKSKGKGKGKGGIAVYGHHLRAKEYHLPYGIDTSEHTSPSPQPVRPVLDLPTPEG